MLYYYYVGEIIIQKYRMLSGQEDHGSLTKNPYKA